MEKYYIAYGSNMDEGQMVYRCPTAQLLGRTELEDYRLLFKGSKTGAYATIEPEEGSRVPVLVWTIEKEDEKRLDRYEGYQVFYYKKDLEIDLAGKRVAPIDKSSTILTMFLAALILGEGLGGMKILCMVLIGTGTLLMIQKREGRAEQPGNSGWLAAALLSAVFASLTAILGKIGIQGVESNLGTAIRTCVVLAMAWLLVFLQGKQKHLGRIAPKSWFFLIISGFATGASWLCYYRALQDGPASIVVPIDKLSILVTILFSRIFLGEKLDRKFFAGLVLLTAGTLLLLF